MFRAVRGETRLVSEANGAEPVRTDAASGQQPSIEERSDGLRPLKYGEFTAAKPV